ncbi:hypothetical protein MKEN_00161500 [Mycena kentingensis (nom. inval.)]|nr:hypothetical protein MKEN_00161500 [Mycena kentingensis (nom. inval.)]
MSTNVQPLSTKLGTNHTPSAAEIAQIEAYIVAPTKELALIDSEIAELKAKLALLEQKREPIASELSDYNALLSPLRRMPVDLLREIFVACLPQGHNCAMKAAQAPLLLGRVSSSWREVSRSTPALWNRLHIACSRHRANVAGIAAAAHEWLARSGAMPLSLSLSIDTELPGMVSTALQSILPYAQRWEHILLRLPGTALDAFARLDLGATPILRTVEMEAEVTPANLSQSGLLSAPILTSLSLTRLYQGDLSGLPVNWENLTQLNFGGYGSAPFDGAAAEALLRQCPNLRNCALTIQDMMLMHFLPAQQATPAFEKVSSSPIELAHLRALRLSVEGGPNAVVGVFSLLTTLVVPELRSLQLFKNSHSLGPGTEDADHTNVFSFPAFFGGCSKLERLFFDASLISKAMLVDAIRALPDTLTHLDISDKPDFGGTVQMDFAFHANANANAAAAPAAGPGVNMNFPNDAFAFPPGPCIDADVLNLLLPPPTTTTTTSSSSSPAHASAPASQSIIAPAPASQSIIAPALVSLTIRGCATLTLPPVLAFYHASYNAPRSVRPHFTRLLIDFGRPKGPQDACDAEMEALLGPPSDSFAQAGELATWKPGELQLASAAGNGATGSEPVLGLKIVYHPVHEGMSSERGPPVYLSEKIGGEADPWGRVHAMTGQMLWT